MSNPSPFTNETIQQQVHLPPDMEGPMLSVSSIIAIAICLSLTVIFIIVIILFVRKRSRTPSRRNSPVANPRHLTASTLGCDLEMTPSPRHSSSAVSSTCEGVPPQYECPAPPGYFEKPHPPTENPSDSR